MLYAGQISFSANIKKALGNKCTLLNFNSLQLGWTLDEDAARKGWKVISTSRSFLLGKAFSKESYLPLESKDLPSNHKEFTEFTQNFWGDYLLIWADSKIYVLRSPSCPIPFFYTKASEEGWIFATSMAALNALASRQFNTDWAYMVSCIQEDSLLGKATPFDSVYQIPLGCFLKLDGKDEELILAWNPLDYVENSQTLHPDDAGNRLMETLKRTCQCWFQSADDIFLSFSGGVDSTVLHYAIYESLGKNQGYYPLHLFNEHNTACDERAIAEL